MSYAKRSDGKPLESYPDDLGRLSEAELFGAYARSSQEALERTETTVRVESGLGHGEPISAGRGARRRDRR